jgi:hypothetical protein
MIMNLIDIFGLLCRMVVDMSADCFWAAVPGGRTNHIATMGESVEQLHRWASADVTVAYDKVCMSAPVAVGVKEEL